MSYKPSARLYPWISMRRRCSASRAIVASSPGISRRRHVAGHARLADRRGELGARLVALLVVLGERAVDDRVHPLRQRGIELADRRMRGVGGCEYGLSSRFAL